MCGVNTYIANNLSIVLETGGNPGPGAVASEEPLACVLASERSEYQKTVALWQSGQTGEEGDTAGQDGRPRVGQPGPPV